MKFCVRFCQACGEKLHHGTDCTIPETPAAELEHWEALPLGPAEPTPDLAGFFVYVGPYRARHVLRRDFFARIQLWWEANTTHTDEDYIHYPRFGKIHKIPWMFLEEFRSLVDIRKGDDHTAVDPGAIIGPESEEDSE